jgi:CheY-like chemotaxis protein
MSDSRTVLVVDNDPALCRLMEIAFTRVGLTVRATGDAIEAEAVLAGPGAQAILMDLNLGAGRSGPELLLAWAERRKLPPCWVVTGTPDDSRLEALAGLQSFQRVVPKPFSVLELAEEVASAANGAIEMGESS